METDTLKFKVGNGTTAWTSLAYFTQGSQGCVTLLFAYWSVNLLVVKSFDIDARFNMISRPNWLGNSPTTWGQTMKKFIASALTAASLVGCTSVEHATVSASEIASHGEAVAVIQGTAIGISAIFHIVNIVNADLDVVVNKLLISEAKAMGGSKVDLKSAMPPPRHGIFALAGGIIGLAALAAWLGLAHSCDPEQGSGVIAGQVTDEAREECAVFPNTEVLALTERVWTPAETFVRTGLLVEEAAVEAGRHALARG